jgi:3-deoxy-D-manno-octulosonate 8-phosphate phosphatase (KDO 8-P phosphatase)
MPRMSQEEYEERLRAIRLLVLDVDGVLTGGEIIFIDDDREAKMFCVRDGSAMFIARLLGVKVAVITARNSRVVQRRFTELPVDHLRQGEKNKLGACIEIQRSEGIGDHEVAYVGDDLLDLPLLEHAGLGITVADGHDKLIELVDWVTKAEGGRGAVREVVDDMVRARGMWDEVLADYRQRQHAPGDRQTESEAR